GGGIRSSGGATFDALNSLFALNRADTSVEVWGNFHTAVHNLLRVNTGTNLVPGNPDPNGNLVGTATQPINPKIGSLANNGGPTLTIALQAGSPAINAGTSAGAPATDQRGVAR